MPRRRLSKIWYKNRKKLFEADASIFWLGLGALFFLTHALEVLSLLVVHDRWVAFSTSDLGAFSKTTLLLSGLFASGVAVFLLIICLGGVLEIKLTLSETSGQEEKLDLLWKEMFRAKSTFLQCKAAIRRAAYALTLLVSGKGFFFHKREARLFKRRRRAFKLQFRRKLYETLRRQNAASSAQSRSNKTGGKSAI